MKREKERSPLTEKNKTSASAKKGGARPTEEKGRKQPFPSI